MADKPLGASAPPQQKGGEQEVRANYCPHCLQWIGGPLLCCYEIETGEELPLLTKAQADALRSKQPAASEG